MSRANPQFQDEHLSKGYTGGQAAARALMAALPGLAGRVSRDADVMPIENTDTKPRDLGQVVVQVFLNKGGLGHALVKVSQQNCSAQAPC